MNQGDKDSNNDSDDFTSNADEQEKVGDLPLKDESVKNTESGNQSKAISAFFGPEKYPAEYYFKETQRYIRQGQDRKAFVILDKFYERNKNEAFSESILLKLGRRYLTAGLNILKQYQLRDELHSKGQTMIILKKLSAMIILWYQALIKILDKNRCYNDEFIIPEQHSDNSTPNPQSSNKQSNFSKKAVGPSSFSNCINKLEKEKRDEQRSIFKYPELGLELIMTDLINPAQLENIHDDVNVAKNLIDFWCHLIDLLLLWSSYYKKMQDAWASYKYMRKAEQFIQQKFFYNTEVTINSYPFYTTLSKKKDQLVKYTLFVDIIINLEIRLLEIGQKTRMMQGQIIMELSLFQDGIEIYEEAFNLQQQILALQMNYKNCLPKDAKKMHIVMANERIEKTVCKICVCLLNMQNCYEQLDKVEQGMECLRLLYWFGVTFIKQQQYSDLLTESFKTYQLYSSKYDELIQMNAEINKVFSIVLNRGQKYIISSSDEVNKNNQDFLDFVNQYLYKKSNAEEINETLCILTKKPIQKTSLQLKIQEQVKNEKSDQLYFSAKSNNSLSSQNRLSKINESKETYYTDENTIVVRQNENKTTDDSLTVSQVNVINATGMSKRDYYLNKTYNTTSNGNITDPLFTLNEESPEKTYQQSRIQIITSSFLQPLNQTEGNILYPKSTQNILSSSSLGKFPNSSTSLQPNKQKFNAIKSVVAFESLKAKDGHKPIWEKVQKNKKKLHEYQKQLNKQNQEDLLNKYQPKLVSSNKFFQDRQYEHKTDAINLKQNKELEIDKIFGVHKKNKYNILEHDVDTFADNIIAREILTQSNCLPYNHLKSATEQNLADYAQEKNEYGFCRKILQLKKMGMTTNLNSKEKEYNIHQMNNEMDREAHDIQTTLLVHNEVQDKKKLFEEAKRIKSLNLDINIMPSEKEEKITSKFKNIMFNHSKQLGLNNVKKSLKKIAASSTKHATEPSQQSLKNLIFAEEEEQLDEVGKLKKTQNVNKETIKLHLTDLDLLLLSANLDIQKSQKNKFLKTYSSLSDFEDKKNKIQSKPQELTIGEKIAKDFGRLSNSTKYYVAKNQGQKINSFFDLVNNKIRLGKIQKEEEQKHRLGTPAMKRTLNEAMRRTSIMRQTLLQHQF